jgi:hypothetical protein
MSGENVSDVTDMESDNEGRQRSKIGFPYNNLGDAIEVTQTLHANVGTGECDDSQLSAWMKQSHKSSSYRIQVSAARMFGLIDSTSGRHKLSALGRMIVDPQREREARAKAFLSVPLYKTLYEQYKGGIVPPAAALERDMVTLGVAEKQTGRARQVFERSAEQAGYFEHGKYHLVMPAFATHDELAAEETKKERENRSSIDPIIGSLLGRLPRSGDVWPEVERKLWLQILEGSFKLIYKEKPTAREGHEDVL